MGVIVFSKIYWFVQSRIFSGYARVLINFSSTYEILTPTLLLKIRQIHQL